MYNFLFGLLVGAVVAAVDEKDVQVVKDKYNKFENKVKKAIAVFNED